MLFTIQQVNELRKPGVYIYRNAEDEIIYVGFTCYGIDRAFDHGHKMRHIENVSIEWIACESESVAFDLEASLIAQHEPEFNALLRIHGRTRLSRKYKHGWKEPIFKDQEE